MELADWLVVFAAVAVVPLGFYVSADRDARGARPATHRAAAFMVPIGSTLAAASYAFPAGRLAGMCAFAWLLATLMIALAGLARIARRGLLPIEELAIDLGHLYLPVGGAWFFAHRLGEPLLGFHEPIVLYTANHFHFAGFAAPVVTGLLGRELGLRRRPGAEPTDPIASPLVRGAYRVGATIVLLGIPLVAAGIVLTHALEMPAAILLGGGMLVVSSLLVRAGVARLVAARRARWSGALLALGGASLVLSMGFAILFTTTGSATRGASGPWVPYATMVAFHGVANAGGFAAASLVAFAILRPERRSGPFGGSFPRLLGDGFVGVDFFDRVGAVDATRTVSGQLGALDAFAHRGFDASRVHARVRHFYENTSAYELRVSPDWRFPFRIAGRLFARLARRFLGNLELPTRADAEPVVTTRFFAVKAEVEGREDARGYVRAYGAGPTARANFVGAYATHTAHGRTLLTPAFPLPFASFMGALRFEDGEREGSLALVSRPAKDEGPGDEGLFLVTRIGALRLPLDERLDVGPSDDGRSVVARHAVWAFGLRVFVLRYECMLVDDRG
ncbi:MAG: YndJ family protein [Polyangiaceae bacterium]